MTAGDAAVTLTDRQRLILATLVELQEATTSRHGRGQVPVWKGGVPAFAIDNLLIRNGDLPRPRNWTSGSYRPRGVANTLVALSRRGLVAGNDTGGVYVSCSWTITDAGRAALNVEGLGSPL